MNIRTRRALFIYVLLICSAAALACTGGGKGRATPSGVTPLGTASAALAEYFDEVQSLDRDASRRLINASGQLATAVSPEDQLRVVRDFIVTQTAVDRDLRDGLQELDPPPEAADAHQEALDALDQFIEFSEELSAQAAMATNVIDIAELVQSEDAQNAQERLAAACQGLLDTAASYGLTILLDCGQ